MIEEKDLKNYPSADFPYAYKRYAHIKHYSFIAYSRFFINRKEKQLYKDINLYSSSSRGRMAVEKDIIYALHEFLIEDSTANQVNENDK